MFFFSNAEEDILNGFRNKYSLYLLKGMLENAVILISLKLISEVSVI